MDKNVEITILNNHFWHPEFIIKYIGSYSSIHLKNNPSGCGSYILHGWYSCATDKLKILLDVLDEILKSRKIDKEKYNIKENPYTVLGDAEVGMIQTVAGDLIYKTTQYKALENFGFKTIIEYTNHRHGDSKQRLLVKIIK